MSKPKISSSPRPHVHGPKHAPPPRPQAATPPKPPAARRTERDAFEIPPKPLDLSALPVISSSEVETMPARALTNASVALGQAAARSADHETLVAFAESLRSVGPNEFREVIERLKSSRQLGPLSDALKRDPEARARFLEAGVKCGFLSATPPRVPMPRGEIVAPPQPPLVRNVPALPFEFRVIIHEENRSKAARYTAAFDSYLASWCDKAMAAKSPHELRALGPPSSPPALIEPGVEARDFKDYGWTSGLTESGRGAQQAWKTLGDKMSDLRGTPRAGSYSLDFELGVKPKADGKVKPTMEFGFEAHASRAGVEVTPKAKVGVQVGPKEFNFKKTIDSKGTEAISVNSSTEAFNAGLEVSVDKNGKAKTTLELGPAPLAATTSVDTDGNFSVGAKVKKDLAGVEVTAKFGLTGYSIQPEYYQDIGGAQPGLFGPMPELDAKVPWASLSKDRRAWYERQGFNAANWGTP